MAHVVITGANRGIGLEFTRQFLARGDNVTALCRHASPELHALGCRVYDGLDLSQDTCIEAISSHLGTKTVDILVNNAGLLHRETLENIDWNTVRAQFEINTMGPLRVVSALQKNLRSGSKIAFITSRMGSIEDNTSGAYYGYRISKAGLNALGKSLAIDLKQQGVAVALLHPGYVATEMTHYSGDITPDVAAHRLIARIDALTLETSGNFWHSDGQSLPW